MRDSDEEDDPFRGERLHFAVQDGDLPRVRELLAEGEDVNAFDDLGKTALHYAVEAGHLDVARCLIEHGADVNARHEPSIGNTPLRQVAATCSLQMATLLIDAGADPTIPGWMQLTAIHQAGARKDAVGAAVLQLLVRAAGRPRP